MEKKFSISQTAKMLGITTDAIRLYEKEGLIKPKRNEYNNYRYYDTSQVRLLTFIAFYRKLGVSIPEIRALLTSSSFDDVQATFEDLIEQNRNQIAQLTTKIERLTSFKNIVKDISENHGKLRIDTMPRGYTVFEKLNADTEFHKINPLLSLSIFSYGNIGYRYFFDDNDITLRYMSYVVWENLINVAPIDRPISEYPVVESCECVCTTTTGHENGILDIDINSLKDFCTSHGYAYTDCYYAFYMYSIPSGDEISDYYNIYFPIKNKKNS